MIEGLTFKPIPSYEEYFENMEKEAARGGRFNLFRALLDILNTEEKKRIDYEKFVQRVEAWRKPLIEHFGDSNARKDA